jgi:hypothetical protein
MSYEGLYDFLLFCFNVDFNFRLRVTVVKKNIGKKRRHLRLLMITNDPMQPKVEINIKAKQ